MVDVGASTMHAAVRLAERGIAVFPLRPQTKAPYGRTIGLHMASADVRTAQERWAGRWMLPLMPIERLRDKNPGKSDDWLMRPVKAQPSANVAVATGAPAGFWVLDEDGPEASAWIAAKEVEHGPLPETVEQQTARGRHRCFLWNDEAAAADISNRSQLSGAPLDVRGDGGYIVVAPSIHPGDPKKGVPPGFVYRWRPGHAPWEMDFAPAPAWLIALVKPKEAPVPVEAKPHVRVEGRASAYGEAALDRAVATIQSARVGSRDSTLYSACCSIGRLVAGGEIEDAYARSALESAGRVHVPSAMSEGQLVRQVDRALGFGAMNPKSAEPRSPASGRHQTGTAPRRAFREAAHEEDGAWKVEVAARLWREARPARGTLVEAYLRVRGITGSVLDQALSLLRFHPAAYHSGPMDRPRLAPAAIGLVMAIGPAGTTMATGGVHVTYLASDGRGKSALEPAKRMWGPQGWTRADGVTRPGGVWLTRPDAEGPLIVADKIESALSAAILSEIEGKGSCRVVATLSLGALQGGWASDPYGRVNADMPKGDPEKPAFTWPEPATAPWGEVRICVDRDMSEIRVRCRKAGGGTWKRPLDGEARARICAGLAEQAWRAAGANAVRIWAPAPGRDFNDELRARIATGGGVG